MTKKPATSDKLFRIAIAQLNPITGDVDGNLALAREARSQAAEKQADLVIFPAFFLTGWPLHDLAKHPGLGTKCYQAIDELTCDTADGGPAILMMNINRIQDVVSSCAIQLLDAGRCHDKKDGFVFDVRGVMLGALSYPDADRRKTLKGAQFIIGFATQPYRTHAPQQRAALAKEWLDSAATPFIHVNLFGAHDGDVFDGGSFGLQGDGRQAFQMSHFEVCMSVSQWQQTLFGWQFLAGDTAELLIAETADYTACMVGLRDYVNKNGFKNVLLGLSGGVDSALCAALAVDALGAKQVHTVMLPYHYTSADSLRDAEECARRLGCTYQTIPIAEPVEAFLKLLQPVFGDRPSDVTEENLQSRCRGVILMALSNKSGALLLTTGNKTEAAVGYATLYGDMCGGFNPIKDLYKKQVYALCHWRNRSVPVGGLGSEGEVIPQNILERAPSAELRPDQKDEDSLPPYEKLDAALESLLTGCSIGEAVKTGYERDLLKRVEDMLYGSEFKRQQSALGVIISSHAFDLNRHMPVTHRFRDKS